MLRMYKTILALGKVTSIYAYTHRERDCTHIHYVHVFINLADGPRSVRYTHVYAYVRMYVHTLREQCVMTRTKRISL